MKFIIFSLFFFLYTSLHAISLRTAVVKTFDNNPNILSEKLNKEAFSKYVDEEEGDYLPTLDLEAYVEDSTTKSDRDDTPTDPSTADKDGWNVSLSLEQIIYDGGLTPSQVEEARHTYLSNTHRSSLRVEEIVRETVNNYLKMVESQELLDLSNINLKIHEDYLVMAREKEEVSGEILETYQVNSKKHFLLDRYNVQNITKVESSNKLSELIGAEEIGNVCRPLIDESLIPDTLEKAIEDALRRNPRILQAMEDIKEQRENIIQANAANLPTLSFQWKGTWDDDLAYPENGRQDISRFRLFLSWNLFEGGKTGIAKEREILFLQEKQKVLDTVVNSVAQDMKTTYTKYFNHRTKIRNYKKYVQDNINIKEVYVKQLAAGTRTFIDILNAESEYYRSYIDLLSFEYELYGYYYDMLQQRGMLGTALLMSEKQVCKPYVNKEYVSIFSKKADDELNDEELLSELGELDGMEVEDSENTLSDNQEQEAIDLTISEKNEDNEVNSLINSESYVTPKKTELNSEENAKETESNEEETEIGNLINGNALQNENENNRKFPEGRYTINLASFDENFDVDSFISNSALDRDKIFQYKTKNRINVLYGSEDGLIEIAELLNSIDKNLINENVYIDTLQKHKIVFDKYKSNNQINGN